MKACILVRVVPGREATVTEALGELESVQGAFPVLGQPEVVVRAEIPGMDALGHLLKQATEIDGVIVSETLLEIPEEAIV